MADETATKTARKQLDDERKLALFDALRADLPDIKARKLTPEQYRAELERRLGFRITIHNLEGARVTCGVTWPGDESPEGLVAAMAAELRALRADVTNIKAALNMQAAANGCSPLFQKPPPN